LTHATALSLRTFVCSSCFTAALVLPNSSLAQSISRDESSPRFSTAVREALEQSFDATVQGGKKKKNDAVFRMEDHPTLHFGIVKIELRARFQGNMRKSDAPLTDEGDLTSDQARKRVGVDGEIGKYVDFQVERELEEIDPWRDVYVNYAQFDEVQFQYGKFKEPFGLDENTGATNLDFVNRSMIADNLASGRDIGFMLHGRVLDRRIRYELGQFDHDGRNARSKNPNTVRVHGDKTTVFRVSAEPLATVKGNLSDLYVGVAWANSDILEEGTSDVRGKTVLGNTFFSSDFPVIGARKRKGFELRWRPGPASVQYEWTRILDERVGLSVEDSDLSPIRGQGWYLAGTVALTGDSKSKGLDATKHPIFQGGFGAVEVAARVERMTFDSTAQNDSIPSTSPRADKILGNSDKALTFGVNWYLNRWVKIQFNTIKETLTDPEQGPVPDKPSFWSRVLRFQFSL
jgi:phosphate-selective porin OprO/OprP